MKQDLVPQSHCPIKPRLKAELNLDRLAPPLSTEGGLQIEAATSHHLVLAVLSLPAHSALAGFSINLTEHQFPICGLQPHWGLYIRYPAYHMFNLRFIIVTKLQSSDLWLGVTTT